MSLGGHKQGDLAGVQAGEPLGRDGLAAGMGAAQQSSACLAVHIREGLHLPLAQTGKTSMLGTFVPPSSLLVAGQCFLQLLERGVG